MLNKNEEIEKVAQQLYKKYKSAFDLVFKYSSPTNGNVIWSKLNDLINSEKSIRPFQSNKTYLRFQPNFLYDNIDNLRNKGLLLPNDDLTSNWVFLFEFNIRKSQINFDCKIGAGDQQTREKLYEIYCKHKEVFAKVDKPLKSIWHQAYQKQILSSKEIEDYYENEKTEELDKIINDRFRELMDNDLQKILEKLNDEINGSR